MHFVAGRDARAHDVPVADRGHTGHELSRRLC